MPAKKVATKKSTKKSYRTGEKCPASGLYEHFCKDKEEKARIPLSKTETFHHAGLAVQLNGF
jgi:hypothetical protein